MFQSVDNSRVAEQHRHERQQVCCDQKDRRNGIVVDGAPRYTDSRDDVAAQTTHGCCKQWQ